jgi:hypothetical protein
VLTVAQVPQAVNYQAVAHNSSGAILTSQHISIRFSIHDGSASATIVFQETDTATTNQFGLFAKAVGIGNVTMGSFSGINWSTGNKYLQIELDPTGGNNFTDMGTMELLSVPYAFYAKDAASVNSAKTLLYLSH